MSDERTPRGQGVYEIRVQGDLDERWTDWFNGLVIVNDGEVTVLTGAVTDQAKLRGILSKLWDLNLTVISVVQIESETCKPHSQPGGE